MVRIAKLPNGEWAAILPGAAVQIFDLEIDFFKAFLDSPDLLAEATPIATIGVVTEIATVERDRVYVNEYEVDRRYGGPEEGGWWYDVGEFINCLGITETEAAAEILRDSHRARLAEVNEGRRELSSVLSNGRRVIHLDNHPGHDVPIEQPHYS